MATRAMKILPNSVLERLIRVSGGSKAEAARQMGVTRQLFGEWCVRGYVPARYANDVEEASGGSILAKQVVEEANEAMADAAVKRKRQRLYA